MDDNEVSGSLGDGAWTISKVGNRAVDISAWTSLNTGKGAAIVERHSAQHLRDFARNLEGAADYLEGK